MTTPEQEPSNIQKLDDAAGRLYKLASNFMQENDVNFIQSVYVAAQLAPRFIVAAILELKIINVPDNVISEIFANVPDFLKEEADAAITAALNLESIDQNKVARKVEELKLEFPQDADIIDEQLSIFRKLVDQESKKPHQDN